MPVNGKQDLIQRLKG